MADRRTDDPEDWEANRRRKLTRGLEATPAQRLAWLEEAIRFAHASGALPRRRVTAEGAGADATKSRG